MSAIATGKKVPDFELPATGDKTVRLSDLRGNNVVLFFYPRDNTPGCTLEGRDFRDRIKEFQAAGTVVLGVSRDSVKSHEKFKAGQAFPFDLLSDQDEQLCALFDVIKGKTMFGKKVRGIQRSTFLLDRQGTLRREWRKVSVKGHVQEVLAAARELAG